MEHATPEGEDTLLQKLRWGPCIPKPAQFLVSDESRVVWDSSESLCRKQPGKVWACNVDGQTPTGLLTSLPRLQHRLWWCSCNIKTLWVLRRFYDFYTCYCCPVRKGPSWDGCWDFAELDCTKQECWWRGREQGCAFYVADRSVPGASAG